MNRIDSLYQESFSPSEFARGYLKYLGEVFERLDENAIAEFIKILSSARERGAKIYFIGNGGSAATASHFANDLGIGTRSWHKPFKAISLCDNQAVITCIGNDFGYDKIFVQQLRVHLTKDDVVVAISASGNSPNVVQAIDYANTVGAFTVGLTGFDGGKLAQQVSLKLHVPTDKGEYGPVEDVHMVMDHLVSNYLIQMCQHENKQNEVAAARKAQPLSDSQNSPV